MPNEWVPVRCRRCGSFIEEDDDRVSEESGWSHFRCLDKTLQSTARVATGVIAGVLTFMLLSCATPKPQLLTAVVHDNLELKIAYESIEKTLTDAKCRLGYLEVIKDSRGDVRVVGVCLDE